MIREINNLIQMCIAELEVLKTARSGLFMINQQNMTLPCVPLTRRYPRYLVQIFNFSLHNVTRVE